MFERYAGEFEHWDRPSEPIDRTTPLLSWSMAKSMLHAAVGIAVGDGLLDLGAPAPVAAWADRDDPRHGVDLEHLLTMRDGLDFTEGYVDGDASDVIEMLFGSGQDDVARFAAERPLCAAPGSRFNYSSGTSNIVARILGEAVGGDVRSFLRDRLFDPIGMHAADARLDEAGTFVASSYVHAPLRQMATFGLLYLRDGVWDGTRIVPEGWVDHGRRQRSWDPVDHEGYGAHWWTTGDELGTFRAAGYQGQTILVCRRTTSWWCAWARPTPPTSPPWRTGATASCAPSGRPATSRAPSARRAPQPPDPCQTRGPRQSAGRTNVVTTPRWSDGQTYPAASDRAAGTSPMMSP